ncbi:carbohydrate ABC transporter permease [Deinococcus deserti]|uniref:Putative sugar ABC transporter, permease component n=1 Tax=Deinococcus deserti (strain DSM 17065 / CIP 109153 / LMG 22923 / VCD115) TaxID=546414 RepID=C1D3G0_DEIDV|nr:carbohydrate ABC transporter permease [Deinococcus deserti]ACO48039.1 putative sugar ABC transporter, permease component [Deinococcus deserti VCD115]
MTRAAFSLSRFTPGRLVRSALLLLAVCITLGPLLYTLLTSLKYLRDITAMNFVFTATPDNYAALFNPSQSNFLRLALNSLMVGVISTAIVTFVGVLGAYSLTRFRWNPGVRTGITWWLLFLNLIPPVVFAGPFYVIARKFGLYDTILAVAIAHAVINLPLAVFIMQSFFAEVPKELEEAAAIDGCSRMQTLVRIILPITRPGIAAASLLAFIFSWKDFLLALSLTSTPKSATIPIGIAAFAQEYSIRYGEMAAAATVATIPAVILVIFAQRHIVRGLTLGAVKG